MIRDAPFFFTTVVVAVGAGTVSGVSAGVSFAMICLFFLSGL
jgi:hypothetical protein